MTKFSIYERIWFVLFLAVGITLSIIWGDSAIGFVAFLSGIACVLLAAKGMKANYIVGIVNCVTYAMVARSAGLYGEAILFMAFYFPIQFIGLWAWGRKTKSDGVVIMEKLTLPIIMIGLFSSLLLVFGVGLLLPIIFEGQVTPFLDAFTSVFSIVAAIAMLMRVREFWWLYFAVNIASIIMWSHQLATGNAAAVTLLVMWSAYLVNSIYGLINWYKGTRNNVCPRELRT